MKKLLVSLSLILHLQIAKSQDFCTTVNKVLSAADIDFINLLDPGRGLSSDLTQYKVDLSFRPGEYGTVIKKGDEMPFFTQPVVLSDQYNKIIADLTTCLVSESNYWKSRGVANGSVFENRTTGLTIEVVKSNNWVYILGYKNKELLKPVFFPDFCSELNTVISLLENDRLSSYKGRFIDSTEKGKRFQSLYSLNHKITTTCYILELEDAFLETTTYKFSDFVMGEQLDTESVLQAFDDCLTQAKGWTKEKISYGAGAVYKKGKIKIEVYQTAESQGNPGNSLISISKSE